MLALLSLILLLGSFSVTTDAFSVTGMCIRHCGHCKEMYGDYFHGQACAESCLMSMGGSVPDCNNPATFNRFLKRFI
ncbi:UNVERIFIED_CONTAM: hypothetical protein GTU68_044510 [Idotea baltica]|nr:hypothetical protein [Idotea baltica]